MTKKPTSKTLVRLSAAIWLENMEWIASVMNKENRNKSDALRLILRRDKERESMEQTEYINALKGEIFGLCKHKQQLADALAECQQIANAAVLKCGNHSIIADSLWQIVQTAQKALIPLA